MSKYWTQQTLAEELQERVSDLEKQLESYQAARVHDVDEKAWLSKRMSAFEEALNAIRVVGTLHDAQQIADNALTPVDGEVKP